MEMAADYRIGLCTVAAIAGLITVSLPLGASAQQPQSVRIEWALDKQPTLTIGGDGSPDTEFLRIVAVFRLSSNRIAVINGGNNEIRLFSGQGKLMRTFGRMGSGPGEFRNIGWVGRAHDTLFVFDHSSRRITTIAMEGDPRLVRSTLLTAQGGRARYLVDGRFADGRWLVRTYTSPGWDGPPGVHRLPASTGWISAAADGDVVWLAERPGLAVFVHNPTGDIKQASVGLVAFTPDFESAASGPFVWLAESSSDSLEQLNLVSSRRRAVRLPFPPVRPSHALVASARKREESTARSEQARSFTEAKFGAKYLPNHLPRFEELLPGPSGELWVQEYAGVRTDSTRYLVLDAELRPVAWVRVAAGFRVREVGADYVLGIYEDADGVESVRMYRMTRR